MAQDDLRRFPRILSQTVSWQSLLRMLGGVCRDGSSIRAGERRQLPPTAGGPCRLLPLPYREGELFKDLYRKSRSDRRASVPRCDEM
ncbi:hypothetical protein KR51_00026750 [Rubidibacter lacunae KORDI 51-2]|uniref:Uncharacterized protein n=1 Tax=Rubidibacter lacunae KORDI 51-2 TaxID=582515 RepID=U5DLV4_9CHRO|nr:hypothetical protein KR51_00026750 [Rubidibacter lacunae KORDI 51-2]